MKIYTLYLKKLGLSPSQVIEVEAFTDRDKDGRISYQEFLSIYNFLDNISKKVEPQIVE